MFKKFKIAVLQPFPETSLKIFFLKFVTQSGTCQVLYEDCDLGVYIPSLLLSHTFRTFAMRLSKSAPYHTHKCDDVQWTSELSSANTNDASIQQTFDVHKSKVDTDIIIRYLNFSYIKKNT